MSSNQNLGDLLRHTRTEVKYSVYFGKKTRRPFTIFSGAAQIPIDTEMGVLNEVLGVVGEPVVGSIDAVSLVYYDQEISSNNVGAIYAKFRAAMLAYIKKFRDDRSYEAAFLAAKEAIRVK